MAPAIPDRWLNYTPSGKQIKGTRFIAFKVPLKEKVAKSVEEETRLDCSNLLQMIPNLGLIIDLTNTYRYYNPKYFESEGVEYFKLMIPGRIVPPQNLIKKFHNYVNDYINRNEDNDKLIGVHCTHGVNRTGYLICNYMISQLSMEPKEAIDTFNRARGHKMERENYLEDLHKLVKLDSISCTDHAALPEEEVSRPQTNSWRARERLDSWRNHDNNERLDSWRNHDNNERLDSWRNHDNNESRNMSRNYRNQRSNQRYQHFNNNNRYNHHSADYDGQYQNYAAVDQEANNTYYNNNNNNNNNTHYRRTSQSRTRPDYYRSTSASSSTTKIHQRRVSNDRSSYSFHKNKPRHYRYNENDTQE